MTEPKTTETCRTIDDYLTKDENNYRVLFDTTPQDRLFEDNSLVEKKQFLRLPSIFDQLFTKLEYKSFMGLFPEINRAWVTFDNRFYIWNFLDGSDFNEYDDLDQVISAVALTVPKKKIFKSYVKYVLVIATSIEVVLVAVTYRNKELNLLPTNYSCSTDNTLILKIACTKNGRIFLSGKNGSVYELEYRLEGGFFSSKIQMVNRTYSIFKSFTPSFLLSEPDPVVDMAIDKSSNALYTLSGSSQVYVYDLGSKGDRFRQVAGEKVVSTLEEDRPQMSREIVQVLGVEQSDSVHLAVINRDGDRIYFDTDMSGNSRPTGISFKDAANVAIEGKKILENVSHSFYQKGVWVFGCSDDRSDDLYFVTTEGKSDLNQSKFLVPVETVSRVRVEGRVLAVSELPGPVKILEKGSEMQLQHRSNNREFVCLTSKGVHIVTKMLPVDKLQQVLDTPSFPQQRVNRFFLKYGSDESCVMCLILICQGVLQGGGRTKVGGRDQIPNAMKSLHQLKRIRTPRVIRNADVAFFHHGGFARYQDPSQRRSGYSSTSFSSRGEKQRKVLHSSVYNGIVLYLSRILKPIWDGKIMHYKEENNVIKIFGVKPQKELLEEIVQLLHGLRRFLAKKSHLYQVPEPRVMGNSDQDQLNPNQPRKEFTRENAVREEKICLNRIYRLLIRSIECLSFLLLLQNIELADLFNCEVEFRWSSAQFKNLVNCFARLTFREYITKSEETPIMKDIVKLIIHQRQCNLEELFLLLGRDCPSLFTSKDICDFQAFNLIQQARTQANTPAGRDMLKGALRAYLRIAGSLESVPTVCHSFIRLKYYEGAVVLALKGAERMDPTQLAEAYRRQAAMFGNSVGSELFKKRVECYKVVERVLDILGGISFEAGMDYRLERANIMEILRSSKDRLFHEYLYETFVEKMEKAASERRAREEEHYRNFLLQNFKMCGYLEDFLLRKKHYYLLGSYYYHCGKYLEAADILDKLASDPTKGGLQLETRIAYLVKALKNAELANKKVNRRVPQVRDISEMVETLKSKIEVANLQRTILIQLRENILMPFRQRGLGGPMGGPFHPSMARRDGENPQQWAESLEQITQRLSYQLVGISFLYNECAIPYELFDSCLKILHLSNYEDKFLIRDLWKKIIHPPRTKQQVAEKFGRLAREIDNKKSKIFPLDYIIAILEKKTFDLRDPYFVVRLVLDNGVSISDLYLAYRKIFEHMFVIRSDPLISDDAYLSELFTTASEMERMGRVHIFRVVCHLLLNLKKEITQDEDFGKMEELFPNYVLMKHLEQYSTCLSQLGQLRIQMESPVVRDIKDTLLKLKQKN